MGINANFFPRNFNLFSFGMQQSCVGTVCSKDKEQGTAVVDVIAGCQALSRLNQLHALFVLV